MPLNRQSPYLLLAIILFSVCARSESPPNIVFILTDDHALKAVSAYDSSLVQTPNIDRIAENGVRFDNAFATNAICAPSRATILTGKFSHKNGQLDNHHIFDGSQPTFPKLLNAAGYQTALIGKWHLKSEPTGFDYWSIFPDQGFYYNPDVNTMGTLQQIEGYATDLVTDLTIRWLEDQRDSSKPFLLFYSHKAPHRNWMPALRHLDAFKDVNFPEPASFNDDYEGKAAASTQLMHLKEHFLPAYDSKITGIPLTERDEDLWQLVYEDRLTSAEKAAWDSTYADERREYIEGLKQGIPIQSLNYQRYMRDYARTVLAIDENVGQLLDFLDENQLTENTLIVYMSDQGMFLGEHGWFDKRWMYEESIRFPLLVSFAKGIEAGQTRPEMVMNVDIAPTLLEYAGIPIPNDVQGRSLKRLLDGDDAEDWREEIYYHYYEYPIMTHVNPHYGVRNSRYKLIRFYGDVDGWEFYDLDNDPIEMNNVYADKAYAKEIAAMKVRLMALREQYQDLDHQ